MLLNFSDCTTANPSISHEAFSSIQFVAAYFVDELLMRKFLKKAISDWRKSPSNVAIDNETEVTGY